MQTETESERPEGESPKPGAGTVPSHGAPHAAAPQPFAASSEPTNKPRRGLFSLWPVVMLVVLIAGGGWLLWNHDLATDWLLLRGYRAPAGIEKLADESSMTGYARRMFYVNKPRVENRNEFNRDCTNQFDQVSVLGCYTGDRQGIYIYNITEKRLDGIQQVTAAHEMLHQAYERLSRKERTAVGKQLEAYAKTVTNPDLLSRFESYKKSEPNDLVNEYHSIFGTEIRDLPAGLEQYYAKYFEDRSIVVGLYDQYQAVFTERTKQIAAYDAQLDTLKKDIDVLKANLNSQEAALKSGRAQLDAYLATNNISAYNAAVPGFNAKVAEYKAAIAKTNQTIVQYNDLIDARNKIAVEEQELQRAIDSTASSASEQ